MKKNRITKKIIFIVLTTAFFVPLIQSNLNIFKITPLKGWTPPANNINFTFNQWWDGDFQKKRTEYINENFGFRNAIIKLNNQIEFTVFKKVHEHGVYFGENGYLYDSGYTGSWLGRNFVGKQKLDSLAYRTKFLQDTLSRLGKNLIIVFAANKSYYFQENLPYRNEKKSLSNYEYLLSKEKTLGVNLIDFNGYFLSHKKLTHYPLFTKYGIHWSIYADAIVLDSIDHYIENKRKIRLPVYDFSKVDWSNIPKDRDADLFDGLNVLQHVPPDTLAYPEISVKNDSGKTRPVLLSIADSFWWGIYNEYVLNKIYTKSEFWYYNNEVWDFGYSKDRLVSQLNVKDEIMKQDVILVVASEASYPNMGWGFIENAYKLFGGK